MREYIKAKLTGYLIFTDQRYRRLSGINSIYMID